MTDKQETRIPETFEDLLGSKALAHVATVGPRGEPQSSPLRFGWVGIVFVGPEHTTKMGS
jgi:hypothetical protein